MKQFDAGRYKLQRIIGSGSYGIVLEAIDTKTGDKVAVKRVSPEIFQDSLLARRILREIKLLAHFDHENIIGLRNILMPHGEDFDIIYIIMDIMETDLKAILKSGQEITESHVQYFIYQILRGLDCIHKADVIHRDLTPSNILLNTNCDLKICDFGLAREESKQDLELTDYVVMRWYRAPELVMEHKHYRTSVDVWACGCIMGEMFHRAKPVFPGKDRIHQLDVILEIVGTPADDEVMKVGSQAAQKYIRRKPKQKGVDFSTYFAAPDGKSLTPDCINLLKRMLEFSPDKRITVHEALNHPYLAELHDLQDELDCLPCKFHFYDGDLTDINQVKKLIFQEIQNIQRRNAEKEQKPIPHIHSIHSTDKLPECGSQTAARKESFAGKGSPHLKHDENAGRTGFLKGCLTRDDSDEGNWSDDSGDGDDKRMS
jgi:mitogen-activated protein kinase 1/3